MSINLNLCLLLLHRTIYYFSQSVSQPVSAANVTIGAYLGSEAVVLHWDVVQHNMRQHLGGLGLGGRGALVVRRARVDVALAKSQNLSADKVERLRVKREIHMQILGYAHIIIIATFVVAID